MCCLCVYLTSSIEDVLSDCSNIPGAVVWVCRSVWADVAEESLASSVDLCSVGSLSSASGDGSNASSICDRFGAASMTVLDGALYACVVNGLYWAWVEVGSGRNVSAGRMSV